MKLFATATCWEKEKNQFSSMELQWAYQLCSSTDVKMDSVCFGFMSVCVCMFVCTHTFCLFCFRRERESEFGWLRKVGRSCRMIILYEKL